MSVTSFFGYKQVSFYRECLGKSRASQWDLTEASSKQRLTFTIRLLTSVFRTMIARLHITLCNCGKWSDQNKQELACSYASDLLGPHALACSRQSFIERRALHSTAVKQNTPECLQILAPTPKCAQLLGRLTHKLVHAPAFTPF